MFHSTLCFEATKGVNAFFPYATPFLGVFPYSTLFFGVLPLSNDTGLFLWTIQQQTNSIIATNITTMPIKIPATAPFEILSFSQIPLFTRKPFVQDLHMRVMESY